ncbi:MAG TPA: TetR/AcrR family transcriptional regulator [Xanthobacteraceae bacterium]|nr:TetR/AcrR family transcriptional regulator [Xanthobacteraceae bacterium]
MPIEYSPGTDAPPRPERKAGLREQGKSERQRRIKEAAKAVFGDVGYDAATTREIARRAHVSIGTIFVYARDKRDLLFLVINDELDPVAEAARRDVPGDKPVLDRLCALARPWYYYFADNLTLGRHAFREMTFYEPESEDFGEQCDRYRARMHRIESWHGEIIAQGQERGELKFKGSAAVAGNLIYKVYLAEIRTWIHGTKPDVGRGIRNLRTKFAMVLDGLRGHDGSRG